MYTLSLVGKHAHTALRARETDNKPYLYVVVLVVVVDVSGGPSRLHRRAPRSINRNETAGITWPYLSPSLLARYYYENQMLSFYSNLREKIDAYSDNVMITDGIHESVKN